MIEVDGVVLFVIRMKMTLANENGELELPLPVHYIRDPRPKKTNCNTESKWVQDHTKIRFIINSIDVL